MRNQKRKLLQKKLRASINNWKGVFDLSFAPFFCVIICEKFDIN